MKILLIYFSGTGNTKMITELYREAFENAEHEVTVTELPSTHERLVETLAESYDIIGIGYPIHAFNAPKLILKLCKLLPKLNAKRGKSKRVFIYKTSGEPVRMSDVSSLKMRKLLKKRGYTVTGEYQYVMPYNIIFRHSDKAAYKMWQTAKSLVPVDADEILRGAPHLPKNVILGGFLAWVLRIEHPGAKFNGKFFRANKDCVKCGLCVKACPADNIKIKPDGKVAFGGNCMMCMRCAFNCPKNAIDIGLFKSWKVNGKYSFDPPDDDSANGKHDNYCLSAYERYYAEAQRRIAQNAAEHGDGIDDIL